MTKPLKIVIPMAGFGTRLRPLTWSKPKPLVSLAGKTVLDHLVDMFHSVPNFINAEFVFILGPMMGDQIQEHVTKTYSNWHVDFALQPEMKGQSDAFWQAREFLHGPMLMAFSDTLIETDFSFLDEEIYDIVAWVKPVPDPRRFGVAEVDETGAVTRLIEKPQDVQNNLAVVGCYYFKEAEALISAIEEQIKRDISLKSEYYLVDAINIMLESGLTMRTERVEMWLDAGTPEAVHETNRYLLSHGRDNNPDLVQLDETQVIPPVFIHPNVKISRSIIGPNTSIGEGAEIQESIIRDSIIGTNAHITDCKLETSLLGHDVSIKGVTGRFHLGDNSIAEGMSS